MNNQEDLETEAAIQRFRHMADTLETSAAKFATVDARDYSKEDTTSLFRKVSQLHTNMAESCRQQLTALLYVGECQADTRKRMAEIRETIKRMEAEFGLRGTDQG